VWFVLRIGTLCVFNVKGVNVRWYIMSCILAHGLVNAADLFSQRQYRLEGQKGVPLYISRNAVASSPSPLVSPRAHVYKKKELPAHNAWRAGRRAGRSIKVIRVQPQSQASERVPEAVVPAVRLERAPRRATPLLARLIAGCCSEAKHDD
jgi:hypothetical protein